MKACILSLLCLIAASAAAQEYKPFKVNLSIGYARPVGPGASGGFLFALEPRYGLSDRFDLGLRVETGVTARSISYNGVNGDADLKGIVSAIGTATYFLSTGEVRPYIGVGGGLYSLAGTTVKITNNQTTDSQSLVADTSIGFMGRAGVKFGHVNLAAEYNVIPDTKVTLQTASLVSKNSYVGLKLGVDLGGGRR